MATAPLVFPAPLSGEVRRHGDAPALHINGEPVQPFMYSLTCVPGGRWPWEEVPQHNLLQFAQAGVRLFQITETFDFVWQRDGAFDVENVRRQIRGVLEACPEAAIMLRLIVHPPKWWYERHPEECVAYADTEPDAVYPGGLLRIIEDDQPAPLRHSLASPRWRTEMSDAVARFCRLLAATPEGNTLIGMLVLSGVFGEWHYWGFLEHEPDVSPTMTRHFRQWLSAKYPGDDALRDAWADPSATLADAEVPGIAERRQSLAGVFRDPLRERRLIDYFTCQHEVVTEDVLLFCRVIKEHWPRPIVTGAFYGYFFAIFNRETHGGHLGLQRVLSAPEIDCLVGPQCYYPDAKGPGMLVRPRGLLASCRAHGKLWLDEYDTEPELPRYTDPTYPQAIHTAIQEMRKHIFCSYAAGMGFWFYDFGVGGLRNFDNCQETRCRGWWDHPALLTDIAQLRTLLAARFQQPYHAEADVLMVYDTEVYYHLSTDPQLTPLAYVQNYWGQAALSRCGVVADYLHVDDLALVDLTRYTTVIFNNTYLITPARLATIQERVLCAGRDILWHYAPGYTDGHTPSLTRMCALTGMRLEEISLPTCPEIHTEGLLPTPFSYRATDGPVTPLFAVSDPTAECLGRYAGTEMTAIARKTAADHTCWYVGLPSYDPSILQAILARCRAHRYSERGDIVLAGGGLLMLHSAEPGVSPVTLRDGTRVEVVIPAGGLTTLLDSETGERVLG